MIYDCLILITGVPSAPLDTAITAKTGTVTSPTLTDGTVQPTLTGELETTTTAETPVERGQRGVILQIYSTGNLFYI